MRFALILCLIAPAPAASARAAEPLTQADLLNRLIDLNRLSLAPPAGERYGLFSSRGAAGGAASVGGAASADAIRFLSRTPDGWDVMAEMVGPGAITRLWCEAPQGELRLVIDGTTVVETPLKELFAGGVEPLGEPLAYQTGPGGGWNCYFPIAYAQRCQVLVRECRSHYQVDYVTFPPDTQVEPFSAELDAAGLEALKAVKSALKHGLKEAQLLGGAKPMTLAIQDDVKPKGKLGDSVEKAGTVRAFYVALTDRTEPRDLYALGQVVLRIWFDGERQPSVEAPLADFFGSGFDRTPFRSLPLGTDFWSDIPTVFVNEGWFMYCFFPMPYRNGMRVELENLSGRKIGLMIYMRIDRRDPPADALRFNARFRAERPAKSAEFDVLRTAGRGRVVGLVLNVDCPRTEWWGAGGYSIALDGRSPVLVGDGVAGLLGDAPALRLFDRPFHGVTRTGPYGKQSGYRWFIGDCVSFDDGVHLRIENRQEAGARDTDYSSVVHWYGGPGVKASGFEPLTIERLTVAGFRMPGTVEIEGAIDGQGWGNVLPQRHAGGVELSGEAAASIQSDQPLTVRLVAPRDGKYALSVRAHPRRSFEAIEVAKADGTPIGTAHYDRNADNGIYTLGAVELRAGENALRVRCTRPAILDCWILRPVEE
ncbi:MAG: DUF2961 domain-containing protein [Phycisphaerae bacterium]|nr:DUF2961 domain-containing protein [Phycisphaerae bacterium]MCZ2399491.1 DUF2961 domain-containing protein [Phycisphaerae bacterium]